MDETRKGLPEYPGVLKGNRLPAAAGRPFRVLPVVVHEKYLRRLPRQPRGYVVENRWIALALLQIIGIEDPVEVRREMRGRVHPVEPVRLVA